MAGFRLSSGEVIEVDEDVLTEVEGKAWRRHKGSVGRTYRYEGKTCRETLASAITGEKAGPGCVWAHLDDNWRNFRRENLVIRPRGWKLAEGREERLFKEGDIRNRQTRNNPTGYVGVNKAGNKFRAVATVNGKQKYLGLRDTPEDAARLYDQALIAQDLPAINFPPDGPSYLEAEQTRIREQKETRLRALRAEVAQLEAELATLPLQKP